MKKRVRISRLFYGESGRDGSQAALTRDILLEERLLLCSIESSLAGCGLLKADMESAGIVVGIDLVIDKIKESYFKGVAADGPLGASPLFFPYTSPNVLAAKATIHFGIKGSDITIASGPLSFLKAVSYAYRLVSSGRAGLAIAAGVTEGAAVSMLLGLPESECALTGVLESRVEPALARSVSSSMKDTFLLFQDAFDAGVDASVEAADCSGNVVRIGLAFDNGLTVKEEAFV